MKLALVALLAPALAHADPKPIAVTGALDGTTATFHVHYTVAFEHAQVAYQLARIVLPIGAAVTRGEVTLDGNRHPFALLDHQVAGDRFEALVARKGSKDRGWAITLEKQGEGVMLGGAVPRAATIDVELDIVVPTCFYADARYVGIPDDWVNATDHALRPKLGSVAIAAHCANGTTSWAAFASLEAAKQPEHIQAIAGRLAVGVTHLARVELALAATLSEVPADLATVIVVDGSRSMTPAALEVQRELVLAYLRAAPHGRIQVIAYARTAQPLLPAWTDAVQAKAKLDRALRALAPRNGSNVDEGIEAAGTWLARTTGTRRAIVLTDELLAERLTMRDATTFRRLLPENTLAHVVAIHGDGESLERDESVVLAGLAIATDGLAARVGTPNLDATELARPIALDSIQVRAPGWTVAQLTPSACTMHVPRLAEGGSCVWWLDGDAIAGPLTIEGLAWGHRVARLVTPDPARGESIARELADLTTVDPTLVEPIAAAAHAVDSKWSLLAMWGGNDGYAGFGGSGLGFGGGGFSDDAISDDFGKPPEVNSPLDLKPQIAAAVAKCKAPAVQLDIETTRQEIVGVVFATSLPAAASTCVETAVWDLALSIPNAPAHATTHVTLP